MHEGLNKQNKRNLLSRLEIGEEGAIPVSAWASMWWGLSPSLPNAKLILQPFELFFWPEIGILSIFKCL